MDWQRAASCRRGLSPPESGAGSIPSECSERSATWWRLDASPPSFVTSGGSEKHGKDSLNIFVLRARSLDALRRAGVTTVGQARSLSQQDLLRVTNIGPKSVADLNRALGEQILGPEDLLSKCPIQVRHALRADIGHPEKVLLGERAGLTDRRDPGAAQSVQ